MRDITNIWIAIAFIAGWVLHAAIDRIVVRIAVRIFASAAGKRAVLKTLAAGIEKLERDA